MTKIHSFLHNFVGYMPSMLLNPRNKYICTNTVPALIESLYKQRGGKPTQGHQGSLLGGPAHLLNLEYRSEASSKETWKNILSISIKKSQCI